jgi:hypothetical protein
MDLATLESCSDLTSELAAQAASSSDGFRTLLKRVAEIARPGQGAPKLLIAVAHLVGQDWIEGELRVELSGDERSTTIIVICEFGEGIRERLVPATRLQVPIDEFERALELSPKLILPLKFTDELDKLVLTPLVSADTKRSGRPPELDLDEVDLGEEERPTAPPPPDELQVIDEASPETPRAPETRRAIELAKDAEREGGEADFGDLDGGWDGVAPEQRESGPVPSEKNVEAAAAAAKEGRTSNVHTRPTVRRMVAIDAAAIAALKRRDPRRDDE